MTEDGHEEAYEVTIKPVSRVVRRNGTLVAKWRRRGIAAWLSSWEAAIMLSFGSFVLGFASYRRGKIDWLWFLLGTVWVINAWRAWRKR